MGTSTLTLNGGTIKASSGAANHATLTLALPGAKNSLGNKKKLLSIPPSPPYPFPSMTAVTDVSTEQKTPPLMRSLIQCFEDPSEQRLLIAKQETRH
jgi:hypothetical protein